MSSGDKTRLAKAEQIAKDFTSLILDVTAAEVCGSIRRGKALVGDIEIVALPEDRRVLLARLDHLILDGTCSKALYGNAMSPRWGETYRGLMFEGMKVEVFCATKENHGYTRWLRTGPGEANTYVMTRMKQTDWPVRFRAGYAWHMQGIEGAIGEGIKLDASTEALVFQYLGISYMAPDARSEGAYALVCRKKPDVYFLREQWLEDTTPKQGSMF